MRSGLKIPCGIRRRGVSVGMRGFVGNGKAPVAGTCGEYKSVDDNARAGLCLKEVVLVLVSDACNRITDIAVMKEAFAFRIKFYGE